MTLTASLVLGLVAVAAVVIGLLIKESDGAGAPSVNLWDRTSAPLWSIVAIVAAVATLLPALRSVLNVPARLAWTIAAVGAAYLVFWWVLFVLPSISLNVAFLVDARRRRRRGGGVDELRQPVPETSTRHREHGESAPSGAVGGDRRDGALPRATARCRLPGTGPRGSRPARRGGRAHRPRTGGPSSAATRAQPGGGCRRRCSASRRRSSSG